MEASVLSQPPKLTAIGVRVPLLRLQSDERLIDLTRAGDEVAFEALVQRYRSRLLAFCRHMVGSREDAEDVLQEVFAASYRAIVADDREIAVRPWLYRIARNMSLKHIAKRRPAADGGVEELEVPAAASTVEAVNMREDLRQIVGDVRELPETQRTALLLRELDGLSYDQIATAMETSVPGVKSLLVRARVSLAEAAEGRLLSCEMVHLELHDAAVGLARLSGPARRHARHCDVCGEYQAELGLRRRAAAAFIPLAPIALLRVLAGRLGIGAAGGTGAGLAGGGAAGGGAAAGGSAGGAVTATLGAVGAKAAVAVATATLVAAGAADMHRASHRHHHESSATRSPRALAPPVVPRRPVVEAAQSLHPHRTSSVPSSPATRAEHRSGVRSGATTGSSRLPPTSGATEGDTFPDSPPPAGSGLSPGGHHAQPTDPATQPIGAPEPVQVQGFDVGGPQAPGSATSPPPSDSASAGGSDTASP
jgi:RNA polymerase sigma factor (sigma-70 family)